MRKFKVYLDSNNYVYYLDVGQGDATFIVSEHRKDIILIDSGGKMEYQKESWQVRNSTFNLAAMYIKRGENKSAYDLIYGLERKVLSSNLPRLKGKLFLYIAIIEYVLGNYEKAYSACENVIKYSNSALNTSSYKIVNQLTQNMDKSYSYTPYLWNKIYSPCFLEYWTINSIEILNDNFLTL